MALRNQRKKKIREKRKKHKIKEKERKKKPLSSVAPICLSGQKSFMLAENRWSNDVIVGKLAAHSNLTTSEFASVCSACVFGRRCECGCACAHIGVLAAMLSSLDSPLGTHRSLVCKLSVRFFLFLFCIMLFFFFSFFLSALYYLSRLSL